MLRLIDSGLAHGLHLSHLGWASDDDPAEAHSGQCLDDAQEAEGVSKRVSEDGRKCFLDAPRSAEAYR